MDKGVDVKTVLWNTTHEHYKLYKTIEDIFCIVKTDKANSKPFSHPFRINMGIMALCTKGSVDVGVDMQRYTLQEGDLLLALPGQIVEHGNISEDNESTIIMYSTEFYSTINLPINLPLFIYNIDAPVVHLTQAQLDIFNTFCMTLMSICDLSIPNKREVFKYQCISFIMAYKNDIINYRKNIQQPNKTIARRFLRLLGKNFKEHKDTQFYADEMHLSKKYFSHLIKEETGKSASEWIEEFIVLEAKNLLGTTDKTIQEISLELNFTSQSFFGKFFKRLTGLSPKEYKKSLLVR